MVFLLLRKRRITISMDECEEASERGHGIEIIDISDLPPLLRFDSALNDEVDIFDMTSLSTLVFLSQRDSSGESGPAATDAEEHRLTLAYERLHSFPRTLLEQFAPTLHTLDISHNEFDNLDFLSEFRSLTTLICDHNNITSSTVVPSLPRLQVLWLNYCKIGELYPWARALRAACPRLRILSLMGNPAAPSYLNGGSFYEYLQYRLFLIALLPALEHLDDRAVTPDQRREARRLYRPPLLERLGLMRSFLNTPSSTSTTNKNNII